MSVLGSMVCAALLRAADHRGEAIAFLPVAWLWGIAAMTAPRPVLSPGQLFIAALLVRLPLVGSPLHLSDDLWRYLWEGLALSSGHNVFLEPPASIDGLDDVLRARVNHPEIPSVYPPLALWWFRALALLGTPAGVQLSTTLLDATIPPALQKTPGRADAAWIYALHPLPAIESAAGGHVDIPAVALAAAALGAWQQSSPRLAFGLGFASALTKLLPIAWLPVLLLSVRRREALLWIAIAAIAAIALSLPALTDDPALWTGMRAYTGRWEFNGCFYPWLSPVLGPSTRSVLVSAAALVTFAVWWRVRDPIRAWQIVGITFLLTSPTVHPWYVLWALVPSLALGRIGVAWASLPLLGSYAVLWAFDPATGAWREAPWLWWITWPPALVLLVFLEREAHALRSEAIPTAE